MTVGGRDAAGSRPALLAPRLSLFYTAYFLFMGVSLPFWPVWLAARGLDAGEIGILLAAPLWIRIVANPLLARLADRSGETRRPLALILAAATGLYGLYIVADGFWQIMAVTLIASALLSAVMPLGDSLTMQIALKGQVQYGRVRLWGSISFIAAASAAGALLAGRPAELILYAVIATLGLSMASALCLPDRRRAAGTAPGGGVLALLGNARFVVFLLAASLIQASHSVLYGFGTLHWQAAGHTKGTIGWLWAEGVAAEILLFAMGSALLARVDGVRLLVLAGAAGVLRWTALGLGTELWLLAAVQVLHGLTFGAAHLAAMDFLARSAPPGLAATAQSLYSAVALGGVFGLTMLLSGRLYAAQQGDAFFAMAVLAGCGTLLALGLAARAGAGGGGAGNRESAP